MEDPEIVRFICANQGAVNTDDLLFNLCSGDSTKLSQVTGNHDKFVSCVVNGQSKVVVRSRLRLCRVRDCATPCRGLHLCKNFLFSGSCRYRGRCCFSHELETFHNKEILAQYELESLDRAELCTLLLQSDHSLLPQICHDYNNGDGEFGRCQELDGCKRLHICEKSISRDCYCHRNHDFNAPQPKRILQERDVPDNIVHSLKFIYSNKEAVRFTDNKSSRGDRGDRGFRGNRGFKVNRGNMGNRGNRGIRGNRGCRGNRGIRGNRGNRDHNHLHRASSTSDILHDLDNLDLYTDDTQSERADSPQPLMDFDDYVSGATSGELWLSKTLVAALGRGGHRGNRGTKTCPTHDLTDGNDGANRRHRPVREKTEICMYFIKGHCKHEDNCYKVHDKMPYRWQVREGDQWTNLANNETIEKDYCDPQNTYSATTPPVHFDTMTCGSNRVRRLSTINSLTEPTFIHTTEWLWFWEDEFGKWNAYSSAADGGHKAADVDSSKLEQKFLDDDKDVVEFTAGSQSYSLSFQDMIQTNKHYSTKRLVRRRPRFVSAADARAKKVRRPPLQPNLYATPHHWDKNRIPETGFQQISLQRSSEEFKEIETMFSKTMRGFDVVSIDRIQNKALWEGFQWQKNLMKTNNSGSIPEERKLFHGTDSKYIDAICRTNFDWRLCGAHGTAYGQGSYFARDAKYSHSYTDDSTVKAMFVARVLVGDYTKGSSSYRRAPSKDGGDVNFFDSCVDDVFNPSIFVVFKEHQIYPEYLLKYKAMHPLVGSHSTTAAVAPRPVPTPRTVSTQPAVPVNPRPTPSYQPTASVPPSTPSYTSSQFRTSSYQPSTSAQPNISSYQRPTSVTSAYQTTSSSYQTSTPAQSSASRYQPSSGTSGYHRVSTPPPAAGKSSDSCVIA